MILPGFAMALELVERGYVPDTLVRRGIRSLNRSALRERERAGVADRQEQFRQLLSEMRNAPIALHTDTANEQHYELPATFFERVLGPHRKYSGCYWPPGVCTLAEAEEASLRATCDHAELTDGQSILELGCGWGSLTLWVAAQYPRSRITSVSNTAEVDEVYVFLAVDLAQRFHRLDQNGYPGQTVKFSLSCEAFLSRRP